MDGSMFIGTWWSLVPPLLAIALALITKEVYSSLFIGVAMGALLYTGFHPWNAFVALFDIMKSSMNLNILIFDVLLGMIIVLMAKSGGSAAYGRCCWCPLRRTGAGCSIARTVPGIRASACCASCCRGSRTR